MRLPIRARLTVIFSALTVAALAMIGTVVYRTFAAELDRTTNERLTAFARELAADFEGGESTVLHDFGQDDSRGYFAQVLTRAGSVTERQGTGPEPLLDQDALQSAPGETLVERPMLHSGRSDGDPVRLAVVPATAGRIVVVGTSLAARHETLHHLARLLWLAGSALGVTVSALAWLLAGAALRPVEALRRKTSLITEGDLAERLPVPDTGDEIATLAATFNDLLARLERAFERERRFVDDASHELRTPLGILKTELDLALRRSRSKEELEAALRSASEESERLNRIAEDLLVLARADRGKLPLQKRAEKPEFLLRRVAHRFRRRAEQQDIRLDVEAPETLEAAIDSVRMEQAVGNLIANALSHTPAGGTITVRAHVNGAHELCISVADSGSGFPEAFIERAFDAFTRADSARSRRDGGVGLGLAIVKGVADAHGGSVKAGNRPEGGAVVTLRLPL